MDAGERVDALRALVHGQQGSRDEGERLSMIQRLVTMDLAIEIAAADIALLLADGPFGWGIVESRLAATLIVLDDQRAVLDMSQATASFSKHPGDLPMPDAVEEEEEPLLVARVVSPLKDRDLEMIALLADGLTLEAIGAEMGMVRETVRSAVTAMKVKAKTAGSTTHLVAVALREGWIP